MRALDWFFLACVVAGLFTFCVPSSLFLRPISIDIQGRQIAVTRELPFGPVEGLVHSEIRMLDGYECDSGGYRPNEWDVVPGNIVTARIGEWAWPCVDRNLPFYIKTRRKVLLGGIIPLWPVTTSEYVDPVIPDLPPSLDTRPYMEVIE